MELINKKCQACEGGVPPLTSREIKEFIAKVPGWDVDKDGKFISRNFAFKSFLPTISLLNAIAYLAQKEGHHPDMEVGYNYLRVKFTTHAINGLSENDFICAAKINAILGN